MRFGRVFKKPDFLKTGLPVYFLSTQITHTFAEAEKNSLVNCKFKTGKV
jgi:hypothetical protein